MKKVISVALVFALCVPLMSAHAEVSLSERVESLKAQVAALLAKTAPSGEVLGAYSTTQTPKQALQDVLSSAQALETKLSAYQGFELCSRPERLAELRTLNATAYVKLEAWRTGYGDLLREYFTPKLGINATYENSQWQLAKNNFATIHNTLGAISSYINCNGTSYLTVSAAVANAHTKARQARVAIAGHALLTSSASSMPTFSGTTISSLNRTYLQQIDDGVEASAEAIVQTNNASSVSGTAGVLSKQARLKIYHRVLDDLVELYRTPVGVHYSSKGGQVTGMLSNSLGAYNLISHNTLNSSLTSKVNLVKSTSGSLASYMSNNPNGDPVAPLPTPPSTGSSVGSDDTPSTSSSCEKLQRGVECE